MKIHEDSSVAVIVKYSVLQITLSLLYLTSEIERNFAYMNMTLYPLRDYLQ